MSRKQPSFAQLYDYIRKGAEAPYALARNLSVRNPLDRDGVVEIFTRNSTRLKDSRARENFLYHEVVSLKDDGRLSRAELESILCDLTNHYLDQRAPNLLAWGQPHRESGHIHFHIMLSSNEADSRRRFRLSKFEFNDIQRDCEKFLQENYPQLMNRSVYGPENQRGSDTPSGADAKPKRRTPHAIERERIRPILQAIFDEEVTHLTPCLENRLAAAGFELYERGEASHGVVCKETSQRYRFKTLGLLDIFKGVRAAEVDREIAKERITTFATPKPRRYECELSDTDLILFM